MSDIPDIVVFIGARYDEREAAAWKAASLCGCHPPAPVWLFGDELTDGRVVVADDPHPDIKRTLSRRWNGSYDGLFMAGHIALNDPRFVLDDIAVKRRILDWTVRLAPDYALGGIIAGEARRIQRWLAAPFASHPDFDPAWTLEPNGA